MTNDELRNFFPTSNTGATIARATVTIKGDDFNRLLSDSDECARLRKALHRIAFEPFGAIDATNGEVLALIENCASEALKGKG